MYLEMVFGALIFVSGVLLGVGICAIIKDDKFKSGEWIKKSKGE